MIDTPVTIEKCPTKNLWSKVIKMTKEDQMLKSFSGLNFVKEKVYFRNYLRKTMVDCVNV